MQRLVFVLHNFPKWQFNKFRRNNLKHQTVYILRVSQTSGWSVLVLWNHLRQAQTSTQDLWKPTSSLWLYWSSCDLDPVLLDTLFRTWPSGPYSTEVKLTPIHNVWGIISYKKRWFWTEVALSNADWEGYDGVIQLRGGETVHWSNRNN